MQSSSASRLSQRDRTGTPIDGFDALHLLDLSGERRGAGTRNIKDFENTGIDVIRPLGLPLMKAFPSGVAYAWPWMPTRLRTGNLSARCP